MSSGITSEVFDAYRQHPTVALLMSGAGSNAEALLVNDEFRDLYDVRVIVTDNPGSNARTIADRFGLGFIERQSVRFSHTEERKAYFSSLGHELTQLGVSATIYAGFMKIASPDFCETFPGVNVHPADLSVKGLDGVAKYRGMDALTLMRGELGYVAATVHVVDNPVDSGSAIAVSNMLYADDKSITDNDVHSDLKELERVIFPKTLVLLGRGALSKEQIPYGQAEIEERYHAA